MAREKKAELRQGVKTAEGAEAAGVISHENRLEFEKLLTELSASFVNIPATEVDSKVEAVLQQIGRILRVDRTDFIQFVEESGKYRITRSWTARGIKRHEKIFAEDYYPWLMEKAKTGTEYITFLAPGDIPDSAVRDRKTIDEMGIKNGLIIPYAVEGEFSAAIAFGNHRENSVSWSEEHIQRLRLMGEVIYNALLRKQAESALAESEKRYRGIFENAVEGIFQTTVQGRFISINPSLARMLGYESAEEVLGSAADLERQVYVDPERRKALFKKLKEKGSVTDFECRFFRKDKSVIWGEIHARSLVDDRGAMTGVEGFVRDITRRKQAREALEHSYSEIRKLKEQLQNENIYLRSEIDAIQKHDEIIGESDGINEVLAKIEQVANINTNVLILGETGTGKELVARAIHKLSDRSKKAMVTVNCAALPASLVESELFGREKGAYTGAGTRQIGRFESADGSTIFLDEIGELSLEMQVKLLRVLQQGQFERLGSSRTISVDVRVLAATNRDLVKEIQESRFRQDLYYRLNVFPIRVPPLRDRVEDILPLTRAFVKELNETMGKRIDVVPRKSIDALERYSWPGNVRELRNVIERAIITSRDRTLVVEPIEWVNPEALGDFSMGNLTLSEYERKYILHILEKTRWRIRGRNGAAEILGLKPTTLYSRMKKLGIARPE